MFVMNINLLSGVHDNHGYLLKVICRYVGPEKHCTAIEIKSVGMLGLCFWLDYILQFGLLKSKSCVRPFPSYSRDKKRT